MHKRQKAYRRGQYAETLAAAFLLLKGYRIVARRWKSVYGEIDVIARGRGAFVFVEVKARPTEREALEAITPTQRHRIAQAASAFLQSRPDAELYGCRFDVIAYSPPLRIKHLVNAWQI